MMEIQKYLFQHLGLLFGYIKRKKEGYALPGIAVQHLLILFWWFKSDLGFLQKKK